MSDKAKRAIWTAHTRLGKLSLTRYSKKTMSRKNLRDTRSSAIGGKGRSGAGFMGGVDPTFDLDIEPTDVAVCHAEADAEEDPADEH